MVMYNHLEEYLFKFWWETFFSIFIKYEFKLIDISKLRVKLKIDMRLAKFNNSSSKFIFYI